MTGDLYGGVQEFWIRRYIIITTLVSIILYLVKVLLIMTLINKTLNLAQLGCLWKSWNGRKFRGIGIT